MKSSIFAAPREDKPMLALGLLLIGVSLLALQDSLIKLIAPDTSFWQLQTIRSTLNLTMIFLLAITTGGLGLLVPRRIGPAIARGLMLAICMVFFFGASQQITITQMAAGLYTYPLFVTLLAGPFLGERIGIWRAGALLLGALGSFTVLNPLADQFSLFQVAPLLAGFFYACNILILRRYCRHESPLALIFVVTFIFLTTGSVGAMVVSHLPLAAETRATVPFVLTGWPHLTSALLIMFGVFSILNLTGNLCLSRAYQTADSSLLAPLDFVYLLFAAMWGRVLFEKWPTPWAVLGIVMIAAAGIITAVREQHQKNKALGTVPQNDADGAADGAADKDR
ncbi:DMT family transporter [Alphaproteobacteria bacterium]|jgi:drug/metabolite transporter (DMT)-like permease|nr:DMT family transporter [Alphaproteobacteria bacterium]